MFQKSSPQLASYDALGDIAPVLFLHWIEESISPPNLVHLASSTETSSLSRVARGIGDSCSVPLIESK